MISIINHNQHKGTNNSKVYLGNGQWVSNHTPGGQEHDQKKHGRKKQTSSKVQAWAEKKFKNPEHAKAFVEWFGDSKVVDENGKPLRVFHGTSKVDLDVIYDGWFSDDREATKEFGDEAVEAYLRIEKPAYDNSALGINEPGDLVDLYKQYSGEDYNDESGPIRDVAVTDVQGGFRKWLISEGYDGIITFDDSNRVEATAYVPFDPTQIKSATGNRGTFDPKDPRIDNHLKDTEGDHDQKKHGRKKQTSSVAFKKWFGDSKVVDENGKPLVMYHGTSANFDQAFDPTQGELGVHFGTQEVASKFGERPNQAGKGNRVFPVYLSIKNPLRMVDKGSWDLTTVKETLIATGDITQAEADAWQDLFQKKWTEHWDKKTKGGFPRNEFIQDFIRDAGYDGVVYVNRREGMTLPEDLWTNSAKLNALTDEEFLARVPDATTSYIAFKPTQIKSATGNKGTFDPKDPRVDNHLKGTKDDHDQGDHAKKGISKSKPKDVSETFGEGHTEESYTHKESGGRMRVMVRPNGVASTLELFVPEEHRGKGIGAELMKAVVADHPKMMGQISSKSAAVIAYRQGRRPFDKPDASLDDVFKLIDEYSSVNLVTPALLDADKGPDVRNGLLAGNTLIYIGNGRYLRKPKVYVGLGKWISNHTPGGHEHDQSKHGRKKNRARQLNLPGMFTKDDLHLRKLRSRSRKWMPIADKIVMDSLGEEVDQYTTWEDIDEDERQELENDWINEHAMDSEYMDEPNEEYVDQIRSEIESRVDTDEDLAREVYKEWAEDNNLEDEWIEEGFDEVTYRGIQLNYTSDEMADAITTDMEKDLEERWQGAKEEAIDTLVEEELQSGETPDWVWEQSMDNARQAFDDMSDTEKFEATGVDSTIEVEEPGEYKLLADGVDYSRTRSVARILQTKLTQRMLEEKGIKLDDGEIRDVAQELWGGWKGSSTDSYGLLIQHATSMELGGVAQEFSEEQMNLIDRAAINLARMTGVSTAGGPDALEAGMNIARAHVGATWQSTQYLIKEAGAGTIPLYRAVLLNGDDLASELHRPVRSGDKEWSQLPTLKLRKNGAQSTAAGDTGLRVANGWGGVGTKPKNPVRVVIRIAAPPEAIISVPAFGINVVGEQEVVVGGLPWKGWDAYRDKAPSFDEVPCCQ